MTLRTYPKITVITPSFNQGEFIEQTIQSVLTQNYPNLEYIVMDGGSTDNTLRILRSFRGKLRWISKKDKGQTDAINKGMRLATGDIVAYLNSDDLYTPSALFTVAQIFSEHQDVQWLTGDYEVIDEHGNQIHAVVVTYKRLLRRFLNRNTLLVANSIIQPSTFWRRSFGKKIGPFNDSLRYCMDFEFWLRAFRKSPVFVIPDVLSKFRIHPGSKGGSQFSRQFAEEHAVILEQTRHTLLHALHLLHAKMVVYFYNKIKK
ncbi:MAG TPA: glycosyltransferase family 2 protein [Candidatus Saccharimonadia bacterium]|nr:glycosyltransferase family 2 protein [Candidatus Saccharimonadia bacterium]